MLKCFNQRKLLTWYSELFYWYYHNQINIKRKLFFIINFMSLRTLVLSHIISHINATRNQVDAPYPNWLVCETIMFRAIHLFFFLCFFFFVAFLLRSRWDFFFFCFNPLKSNFCCTIPWLNQFVERKWFILHTTLKISDRKRSYNTKRLGNWNAQEIVYFIMLCIKTMCSLMFYFKMMIRGNDTIHKFM